MDEDEVNVILKNIVSKRGVFPDFREFVIFMYIYDLWLEHIENDNYNSGETSTKQHNFIRINERMFSEINILYFSIHETQMKCETTTVDEKRATMEKWMKQIL